MTKHQLPCHGKLPVGTAGCFLLFKVKNIFSLNFSYVSNNKGNILKKTTKIKLTQYCSFMPLMHSQQKRVKDIFLTDKNSELSVKTALSVQNELIVLKKTN